MQKENFFKDMYEDFFGIDALRKENEELAKKLGISDDTEVPSIQIGKNELDEKDTKKDETIDYKNEKDEFMKKIFENIEELYVDESIKNKLKKIIEYMRKYNENTETMYIPFNIVVYTTNNDELNKIIQIITKSSNMFSYVKKGRTVELSLYNLDNVEKLTQLYSDENSVIVIKDFDIVLKQEKIFKERLIHFIESTITKKEKEFLTILNFEDKEKCLEFFDNEKISNLFSLEIEVKELDVQDVYNEIKEILKKQGELDDDFCIKLLEYIEATYKNTTLNFPEYRDTLVKKILINKEEKFDSSLIPEYEKDKTNDEIFEELNELVGLKKVKQVLHELVDLIELKKKTKGSLKIKDTNLHMIFLGNPGTGKTTVARHVAEILYNLKYIRQNKLIEVSSKDLVAEYVGQTAPKTMSVINKALGGVLFIDEAYSLASGNGTGNSFNEEAIATLIQAMENYRDDLVVIFAGYTKEMQAFLNSNSGIVSRIGYTFEFEDYTKEELTLIFKQMMKKAGFNVDKEAITKLGEIIDEYKGTKNFGNARFIRNVYEKSVIKHASNTKGEKSKKVLKTITKDDITVDNLLKM